MMSATRRQIRAGTIHGAFLETAALFPARTAITYKRPDGALRSITFRELRETVERVAQSLVNLGIKKGDRVAICSYNGRSWIVADLATLELGAIVVPIYHTLPRPCVASILRDSGAKLVFAEDRTVLETIEGARSEIPSLRTIVVFDSAGLEGRKGFLKLSDLKGKPRTADEAGAVRREIRGPAPAVARKVTPAGQGLPSVSPEDVATIVYTSGTTGDPKGVVLTHANVMSNVLAGVERFHTSPEDVFLSFLPMSHMLERIAGYYSNLLSGATVVFGGGLSTIREDVLSVRPTVLIVVPRILEKFHEAAREKVTRSPAWRRKMVESAIDALNRRANFRYREETVPASLKLRCWFFDRAVVSALRKIAGGRLRLLVCGGAPLDKKLAKLLLILGFNIVEGYGLTEASLAVSTCALEDNHLGTVGKPYPTTQIKIGENDEILVKGPGVMKCYHNRPEDTAAAIDPQGWLHTGDQGRLDERGNLVITGRIKELIVTSYGKNVATAFVEGELTRSPYIDQAAVFGDRRKYIAALIVPNRKMIEGFAKTLGSAGQDYLATLGRQEIRDLIAAEIEKMGAACSAHEKIRAFTLLSEGFTVENELLTPTLKLRRGKIEKKYAAEIASMYASSESESKCQTASS